jgi:hypothetical protein
MKISQGIFINHSSLGTHISIIALTILLKTSSLRSHDVFNKIVSAQFF